MPPDYGIGSTVSSMVRNFGVSVIISRVSVAELDPATKEPRIPDVKEDFYFFGHWRDATYTELANDVFNTEDAIVDVPGRNALLAVGTLGTVGVTPKASDYATVDGVKYRIRRVMHKRAGMSEPYIFSLALQRVS